MNLGTRRPAVGEFGTGRKWAFSQGWDMRRLRNIRIDLKWETCLFRRFLLRTALQLRHCRNHPFKYKKLKKE